MATAEPPFNPTQVVSAGRMVTPKRNNSHMSPPDKSVQTKMTILSPTFKDLFVNTMRKEMIKQNDGYDTDDEIPLSWLKKKNNNAPVQATIGTVGNPNTGVINHDRDGDGIQARIGTVGNPNTGVINHDRDGDGIQACDSAKQVHTQKEVKRGEVEEVIILNDDGHDQVTHSEGAIENENKDQDDEENMSGDDEHMSGNSEQRNGGKTDMMSKLFDSIEAMSKKLERLEVVERDVKDLRKSILQKEDIESIIQKELIGVKKTLVSHDLKINKQQNEISHMDKRLNKRIEAIEKRLDDTPDQEAGIQRREVEQMIEKASESMHMEQGKAPNVQSAGKTNRNLIIHGIEETRKVQDLVKIQDVAYDIGLSLHRWDVDKTTRLGAYEKGKKRPVKVELVSETPKMDFLRNKSKLQTSELYKDILVVPDETKEVRYAKAILRQAAYLAKRNGDKVWRRHDLIWVNGVKYTVETVDQIPDQLRFKRKEQDKERMNDTNVDNVKQKTIPEKEKEDDEGIEEMEVTAPQDIGDKDFVNKNWDQAARAAHDTHTDLEQNGAVHLTKRGLAFFTGKTFLSNFYLVEFKFNGRIFYSSEQAYQFEKASICRDAMRMERIYKATTPKEAKDIGGEVKTTPIIMGKT